MLKFKCHIRGLVPLLFNRFPEEEGTGGARKKAPKSKEEQVEMSLYRMKDKTIYQPEDHIIGAMIKAGVAFKLRGAGKKTMKDLVKGGVFIEPIQISHLFQKYTMDYRSVVINRGRVMKARARMDKWELKFEITCIDDRATAKDIEDILKYAGGYVGIGDYRPRYGRFDIVSMDEVK